MTAPFYDIGTPSDYLTTTLAIAAAEGLASPVPGARCTIDPSASIERTAIWDDVVIGERCRLVDCIVADGVRVPPNTVCEREIITRVQDRGQSPGRALADVWNRAARPVGRADTTMTTSAPPPDDRVATYLERVGLAQRSTVIALKGDASDRRYVRVILGDGSSQMVLVHSGPIDPATLPFLNVARLLQQMSVPIPRVRDVAADLGILVLDDLGDVTLQAALPAASPDQRRALYAEAVAMIARMQRRGRELASESYLPFTQAFDEEKLMSELRFFSTHYLGHHRRAHLAAAAVRALEDEFRLLARALAGEPRVLCHRDYHSRNLMVQEGALFVIDFQDARLGPDTYDLVSLLRDCYVTLPQSLVDDMLAVYHQHIGSDTHAANPGYLERFDRMSVQRHLKALGTFGYQAEVVGNLQYLEDVPRTLEYLVEVFQRRRQFDRLRDLLAPHVPALG